MCPNFEPRLRGVVYQLSWVTIHNIKPTHVDYYHVEGFKDCSMYSRKNLVLIIHTRDETPCRNLSQRTGHLPDSEPIHMLRELHRVLLAPGTESGVAADPVL